MRINNSSPDILDPDVEVITDPMEDLLYELGIKKTKRYYLILWNDEVNSAEWVTISLFEICELTPEEAVKVMFEAHTKGRAVAKTGSFEDMNKMKKGLNERNIEASVEDEDEQE